MLKIFTIDSNRNKTEKITESSKFIYFKLLELIAEKGLTLEQVAGRMCMKISDLKELLNGSREWSLSTMYAICSALELVRPYDFELFNPVEIIV